MVAHDEGYHAAVSGLGTENHLEECRWHSHLHLFADVAVRIIENRTGSHYHTAKMLRPVANFYFETVPTAHIEVVVLRADIGHKE